MKKFTKPGIIILIIGITIFGAGYYWYRSLFKDFSHYETVASDLTYVKTGKLVGLSKSGDKYYEIKNENPDDLLYVEYPWMSGGNIVKSKTAKVPELNDSDCIYILNMNSNDWIMLNDKDIIDSLKSIITDGDKREVFQVGMTYTGLIRFSYSEHPGLCYWYECYKDFEGNVLIGGTAYVYQTKDLLSAYYQ